MRRFVVLAGLYAIAGCRPPVTGPSAPAASTRDATFATDDDARPARASTATGPWGPPPPDAWASASEVDPTILDAGSAGPLSGPRVIIGQRRTLWLQPSGPAWGSPEATAWDGPAPECIEVPDPHGLRLVVEAASFRLLVYASPDDLAPIVVRRTPVHDGPRTAAPPATGRVELLPGAVVDIVQRRAGWAEVAHRTEDGVEVRGWIPRDTVGSRFAPGDVATPSLDAHTIGLEPGATVRRGPKSEPLVSVPEGARWTARDLGRAGRYRRVRLSAPCRPGFVAEGVVLRSETGRPDPQPVQCTPASAASWGELADAPRRLLAPGTTLLERADGDVVGVTLSETEVADTGDGALWLASPWGPLPVAVPTPLAPPDG